MQDVAVGLDRLAAAVLGGGDQAADQRMAGALGREDQPARDMAGIQRLGQDAQALGKEQALLAAMPLLPQQP